MRFWIAIAFLHCVSASALVSPPKSAVVVAFEDTYDLSLLANTLSDQGIYATLVILQTETKIYEHLIDVEVLRINGTIFGAHNSEARALDACRNLLSDDNILIKMNEIQPTFVIFPAIRHDGCLLPWTKSMNAIPVIWARGLTEEIYAFDQTKVALPINNGGFFSTLFSHVNTRILANSARNNYIKPALQLVSKHLSNVDTDMERLYSSVNLVLWGADPILRVPGAPLTQFFVEVGCHHCRGPQPLPSEIQKKLIEFKSGLIVVFLEKMYSKLVQELAQLIPGGRDGQAILWNVKDANLENIPENLFVYENIDRQDIVGFSRTRVLLSHCPDTEVLEAINQGTPLICFPRNPEESRNALRAVELGFAISTFNDISTNTIGSHIAQIHETASYRENARKASLAVRDRLNPAMDRLTFWLNYLAKNKGAGPSMLAPPLVVTTFAESFQLILGFFIGTAFSICLFFMYFLAHFITERERPVKAKKYKK